MSRVAARELKRPLQAFARAIRARHLYRSNNAAFIRAMKDLETQLAAALTEHETLAFGIRPDSIVFDDEVVFEEPNPDDSIPFILYRDGIRRLELKSGLGADEIEALVSSIAEGFHSHGLGDDIVSTLWRHDLEHIHYVVVDANIGDALPASMQAASSAEAGPVDAQVDALLMQIYGEGSADVGQKVAHVDALDIHAKAIAEQLDDVDEMGAEFHPARRLELTPPYVSELLQDSVREDEGAIAMRLVFASFHGLAGDELGKQDKLALGDRLLNVFDSFIVTGALGRATKVILGLHQLEKRPGLGPLVHSLMGQALSDARLRQVVSQMAQIGSTDVLALFRAAGPSGVPSLLGLVPRVDDPNDRREFANLALEIGIRDVAPIEPLLEDPQAYVAREAVYILSRIDTDPARALLAKAEQHPQGPVRQALAQVLPSLGARSFEIGVRLLDDPEQDVATAAARALGGSRDARAGKQLEARMSDPKFIASSLALKQAFVAAYALIAQNQGVATLARMLKEGDGIMANKDQEDLAVASTQALGFLRTPGAIAALKKSSGCLNKRVREAAREALRKSGVEI